MSEKYSVLMSLYYKEKKEFFRISIESMLSQTIKPEQVVIVKDGKLTNELDEVVEYYQNLYPHLFTIVSLEENVGLGLALNEGLKFCRNELVARMDSDDISLSNRCELQLKEFEIDKNLSIIGTMTSEFIDDPSYIISSRVVPVKHDDIVKFSKRRSPFNHPTVMFKKQAVLNCGGYRDILRKEDIDLFGRMLMNGYKAKNINSQLLYYRTNEDNYKRRKEWSNCKSYIKVIYNFWKIGYSSLLDLFIVILGQLIMFLAPVWLLKILSKKILRNSSTY